jgi:hypothetical protein
VKVAYLLVTTAWLVGAQTPGAAQDAAKQPAAPAAVAPVTVYGNCNSCNTCNTCNSCDSGCGFLQRCRDFCSRLFSSNSCNSCGNSCYSCNTCAQPVYQPAPTCCAPAPSCYSGCGSSCFSGCGHSWFSGWGHSCFSGCNTCSTGCNTCSTGCSTCNTGCSSCGSGCGLWSAHGGCCGNDGCGGGFLQRCRDFCARLCHRDDCCNTCNTCNTGYAGSVIVAPKGAETIPPPAPGKDKPAQPMPGGKTGGGEPPQTQIQIINPAYPSALTPNLETPPAPPAVAPGVINQGRPF